MPVEWYFRTMGEVIGPLTSKEIRLLALAGDITHDTLVSRTGTDEWVTADRIAGLLAAPTEDESQALSSPKKPSQVTDQSARVAYWQDLASAWRELWGAFSRREQRIGVAVAAGLLLFIVAAANDKENKFAPAPFSEPSSFVPRERSNDRVAGDRDLFFDPNRNPPYFANEQSGHQTRREAITALALQFGADENWIEANMGSSNSLITIHSNLSRAYLRRGGLKTR